MGSQKVNAESATVVKLSNTIKAQEAEIKTLKKIIAEKKYDLTEQEAIDVANKIKSLENEVSKLKVIVSKQESLIDGLKKENNLQGKYILSLESENDMLKDSIKNQKESFDSALANANQVIGLQKEQLMLKDDIINEQEKMYSMSFIEKIEYIALGVAIYSTADLLIEN